MQSIFLQGFLLQASMIFAFGAQNLFVLNSGLYRQRHLLVASLCSVCDTILIFIGVLGVATFFVQVPFLKMIFGLLGVLFLFYYGLLKVKESLRDEAQLSHKFHAASLQKTVITTLAFTLLNPHVYLDTIILIGGFSSKFSLLIDRFYFGLGASACSFLWFFGLANLASIGNKIVHNPKIMRFISAISGIVLLWLSFKLGVDVSSWINDYK